jgi:arylsulfatase A-like enzyme
MLGQHRLIAKFLPYEESIQVPLFIYVPGYEKQTVISLVTNNDLAPTIADMANIKTDFQMDGLSLMKLLENPHTNEWRNKFLIEHFGGPASTHFAVRTNSSIFIEYKDSIEFYNLKEDPYQLISIHNCNSEDCRKEIESHKKWLNKLKNCSSGSCQEFEKN